VNGFTLDREIGEFMLTHPDITIEPDTAEFAINASNSRHWEPAIKRYVNECLAGQAGPRGRDFNMRWIASLVAETHRILMRGGVFMYPRDRKDPSKAGRLRLLYEATRLAFSSSRRAAAPAPDINPSRSAAAGRARADWIRVRSPQRGRAHRAVSPRSQRVRIRCAAFRYTRPVYYARLTGV